MKVFDWLKSKKDQKTKSKKREWGDAIVFAVIAATLLRWATFEAFAIPTPSMEGSLLAGDYLFVSKLHYGARTPKTLLQIPLMHQKIMGTDIQSYSSLIQLPQFRLPGFQKLKNNETVVFNYPEEMERPSDQKTYYVKRCLGIAGDAIQVIDSRVYINGKFVQNPIHTQYSYLIQCEGHLNKKFFEKYRLYQYQGGPGNYVVHTEPAIAEDIAKLPFISKMTLLKKNLDM